MESATSTLSALPSNKEQISFFAQKIITELDNGEVDPLVLLKMKKSIDKVFEQVNDKLRSCSVDVAEKYGKGKFGLHGAEYEVKEMGVRYDYDGCNDPVYTKMKSDIKKREAFLKSLTEPFKYIDPDTGEEVTINPPIKTSTTTVQVTL